MTIEWYITIFVSALMGAVVSVTMKQSAWWRNRFFKVQNELLDERIVMVQCLERFRAAARLAQTFAEYVELVEPADIRQQQMRRELLELFESFEEAMRFGDGRPDSISTESNANVENMNNGEET